MGDATNRVDRDGEAALAQLEASLEWARPTGYAPAVKWCRVVSFAGGSVSTTCHGRFAMSDGYETAAAPPSEDRCGGCEPKVEAGLAELRSAPVVRTHTTRSEGVLFEAWDFTDGGEA